MKIGSIAPDYLHGGAAFDINSSGLPPETVRRPVTQAERTQVVLRRLGLARALADEAGEASAYGFELLLDFCRYGARFEFEDWDEETSPRLEALGLGSFLEPPWDTEDDAPRDTEDDAWMASDAEMAALSRAPLNHYVLGSIAPNPAWPRECRSLFHRLAETVFSHSGLPGPMLANRDAAGGSDKESRGDAGELAQALSAMSAQWTYDYDSPDMKQRFEDAVEALDAYEAIPPQSLVAAVADILTFFELSNADGAFDADLLRLVGRVLELDLAHADVPAIVDRTFSAICLRNPTLVRSCEGVDAIHRHYGSTDFASITMQVVASEVRAFRFASELLGARTPLEKIEAAAASTKRYDETLALCQELRARIPSVSSRTVASEVMADLVKRATLSTEEKSEAILAAFEEDATGHPWKKEDLRHLRTYLDSMRSKLQAVGAPQSALDRMQKAHDAIPVVAEGIRSKLPDAPKGNVGHVKSPRFTFVHAKKKLFVWFEVDGATLLRAEGSIGEEDSVAPTAEACVSPAVALRNRDRATAKLVAQGYAFGKS